MTQRILPLCFITLLVCWLFAAQGNAQQALLEAEQSPIAWVDASTGTTLFTLDDIVRFDWGKQMFELAPRRATELLALPLSVDGFRDFLLKDAEGVIYRGRLYRSSATAGYDGSVILLDQGQQKKLPAAPFFQINGGYLTGAAADNVQQRLSERLRVPLEQAGKLAPIYAAEMPMKSVWSAHAWVGGEQGLKASLVLFPSTFVLDRFAYMHLLLYKGNRTDFQFDQLRIEASCTSPTTPFTSHHLLATIDAPLPANGIYVCKFTPWQGTLPEIPMNDANRPVIITNIQLPRYTKDALNEHYQGTMTMLLAIDEAGQLDKIDVLQSSGREDLDRAAQRAVTRWTFTPAVRDGKLIPNQLKITLTFKDGEVSHHALPPEPVAVSAAPGPLKMLITVTALKKQNGTMAPFDSWTLPEREIIILPSETIPAPAVTVD